MLIRHNRCYKSTLMFIIVNLTCNCFLIQSLHPLREHRQNRNVDFSQLELLTRISGASRKAETKRKSVTSMLLSEVFYLGKLQNFAGNLSGDIHGMNFAQYRL